ncbi:hypothetical protein OPV22_021207 [Ensete ventricosum]|uniref:WRC domain-containing protein n=1 Tax=Ensete ventricosum TaxID=4639 RepID=A0AAV8QI91_ENSVE|nr:hypothetical protein OPV22_021207 [Ensete ventricosum]
MRIRKRPPFSSSHSLLPFLPPPSDPPCQVHPPSGRRETKESTAGEVLHPVGDVPIDPHELGENSMRRPSPGPPLSDPVANGDSRSRERVQVPKVKEGRSVDSSNQRWNAKADSSHSHRVRGNSGAVALGAAAQTKTMEGNDDGNGDGGLETKLVEQEKKAKVKAKASAGPAAANDNDCISVGDRDKEGCDGGAAVVRAGNGSNFDGKRRRRPAAPMEGSRCSRVNGRGWRCCQKTLVGYSLCEHHLGKGRLRSMRSVRGQLGISKPNWSTGGRNSVAPSTSPQRQPEKEEEHARQSLHLLVAADNEADKIEEDEEEEEEKMVRKKRKKIGMVKARSISSLLDGANHRVLSPSLLSQAPEVGNEAKSSVS